LECRAGAHALIRVVLIPFSSREGAVDPNISKLLQDALELPPDGRAALAGSLIDSLDETVETEAEQAWRSRSAVASSRSMRVACSL